MIATFETWHYGYELQLVCVFCSLLVSGKKIKTTRRAAYDLPLNVGVREDYQQVSFIVRHFLTFGIADPFRPPSFNIFRGVIENP